MRKSGKSEHVTHPIKVLRSKQKASQGLTTAHTVSCECECPRRGFLRVSEYQRLSVKEPVMLPRHTQQPTQLLTEAESP
jgi:hypothetical protein